MLLQYCNNKPHTPPSVAMNFIPYNPNPSSTVTRTTKYKTVAKIPKNVVTCLQVQNTERATGTSNDFSSICLNCGIFQLEHCLNSRLRDLKDNSPLSKVPVRYRCQTLWIPNGTPLVTPSPDSSLFSSSPDPPILSQAHSSLSPVQGNNRSKRSKANYSNGR